MEIMIAQIEQIVCNGEKIEPEALHTKSRLAIVREPRQIVMYFADRETRLSQGRIGMYFNRDHATVINAIKRVNNFIETDREFRDKINYYQFRITNLKTGYENMEQAQPTIFDIALVRSEIKILQNRLKEKQDLLLKLLKQLKKEPAL